MSQVEISVDEVVASLKNTTLPTVLVEGRDDMTVYRWIESCLGIHRANVLPCGGRDTLLKVYDRRSEFSHLKCAFLADRDMWLYDRTCSYYNSIIFTEGYSIENDLLDGSHVYDLLSATEQGAFQSTAAALSKWFAFEVQEYRAGRAYSVDVHPNQVVPLGSTVLDHGFLAKRGYRAAPVTLVRSIERHFTMRFRGKSIIELYVRFLSSSKRRSKFSKCNLLEIATKCDMRPRMERIVNLVIQKMS